jgi:hypothetical protein
MGIDIMARDRSSRLVLVAGCVLPLLLGNVEVRGAPSRDEVVNSVLANFRRIQDCEASIDVYFGMFQVKDMSESLIKWKRAATEVPKALYNFGSPYWVTFTCDGSMWHIVDGKNSNVLVDPNNMRTFLRANGGIDMFFMEPIVASEQWTLDTQPATVNSARCYRLYTTKSEHNYEVWVDAFTMKKIMRVKATGVDDKMQWQFDYLDYQETTEGVWLPFTILAAGQLPSVGEYCVTYAFSNIDLNKGIPDSTFDITEGRKLAQEEFRQKYQNK